MDRFRKACVVALCVVALGCGGGKKKSPKREEKSISCGEFYKRVLECNLIKKKELPSGIAARIKREGFKNLKCHEAGLEKWLQQGRCSLKDCDAVKRCAKGYTTPLAVTRVEYGKKHKITKKGASLIERFSAKMRKCSKEVFTHKKLIYKPPKGAEKDGYAKAVGVVIKEIRVCMQGRKSADGKGFSGPLLKEKQLASIVRAKDCADFATKFVRMAACETRLEALVDDAGFVDTEDDGDEGGGAKGKGMKSP